MQNPKIFSLISIYLIPHSILQGWPVSSSTFLTAIQMASQLSFTEVMYQQNHPKTIKLTIFLRTLTVFTFFQTRPELSNRKNRPRWNGPSLWASPTPTASLPCTWLPWVWWLAPSNVHIAPKNGWMEWWVGPLGEKECVSKKRKWGRWT